MAHKNSHIDTAISLTLVIVATLSGYLLSDWEKWETTLTAYLSYKWAVQLCTISLLLLFLFFPFWLSRKKSTNRRLNNKEIVLLTQTIENAVGSGYQLHHLNILEKKIESAVAKEAASKARLPQGRLNKALIDILTSEISVFSDILQNAVNEAIANFDKHNLLKPLESVIRKLLVSHKDNIAQEYNSYLHLYFPREPFTGFHLMCENSFLRSAEYETKQRIKHITASLELNKFN